ncbi:MAG: HD domain-containing protein [Clostridiales bacterium]
MEKLGVIINLPQYQEYCKAIENEEKNRVFCHHDITHFAEVARTAYILYLTNEVPCPELKAFSEETIKELIYVFGFLHDIGRFLEYQDNEKDHAVESEKLSRPFLKEAGFSHAEQEIILKAIKNHRCDDTQGFDRLTYLADKKSRLCTGCSGLIHCKKFANGQIPEVVI